MQQKCNEENLCFCLNFGYHFQVINEFGLSNFLSLKFLCHTHVIQKIHVHLHFIFNQILTG
jgi:hypothetical protein